MPSTATHSIADTVVPGTSSQASEQGSTLAPAWQRIALAAMQGYGHAAESIHLHGAASGIAVAACVLSGEVDPGTTDNPAASATVQREDYRAGISYWFPRTATRVASGLVQVSSTQSC